MPARFSVYELSELARPFDVSLPVVAIRLPRARGGFQAFGVDGSQVTWSAGELRCGPASMLPDGPREIVLATLEGKTDMPQEVIMTRGASDGTMGRQPAARRRESLGRRRPPAITRPRHAGSRSTISGPLMLPPVSMGTKIAGIAGTRACST